MPRRQRGDWGTAQAPDAQELDCPTLPSAEPVENALRKGKEAWQRLQNKQTWQDWCAVGKAHLIGRAEAMYETCVNTPKGRRYNSAFTPWSYKNGFENLDKGDRCRLFEVMDHLPEIETWRQTLAPRDRAGLNHPSTVLRRWKAAERATQKIEHQLSRSALEQADPGNLNPLAWANASPAERQHFINSIGWQTIGEAIPADWRPAIEEWLHPKPRPTIIDRDGYPIPEDLSIPAFLKVVSPDGVTTDTRGAK